MTFLWGWQDAALNTFQSVVMGSEFESKITPFSCFRFIQSLFAFVFLFLETYISTHEHYLWYYSASGLFGILSLAMMIGFKFKGKKPEKIFHVEYNELMTIR